MADFTEYLKEKNIDPARFEKSDPDRFFQFNQLFDQMHPKSFTAQKLFLINRIRRAYPFEQVQTEIKEKTAVKLKPKLTPRIKT